MSTKIVGLSTKRAGISKGNGTKATETSKRNRREIAQISEASFGTDKSWKFYKKEIFFFAEHHLECN